MRVEKVSKIIERPAKSGTSGSVINKLINQYKGRKGVLISLLQDIQAEENWLPEDALRQINRSLGIPMRDIYGVATFYAQFRFHPPGRHHIHVCMGTACHVRGGQQLLNTLEHRLGITDGQTTPDRMYDLNRVACLGCCALAPVVMLDDKVHSQMSVLNLRRLMDEYDQAGSATD